MPLLDHRGVPIVLNKKAPPPKLGEAFGAWAGRDVEFFTMPGGGVVQFDLSNLTLQDFRQMRDHYQVNASLAVLTFMQHQSDWHIESESPRVAAFCEDNLREVWTGLNRAMGAANWAGFSPNVLQWENVGSKTRVTKVKDLIPEECEINWKKVPGWAPPGRTPPLYNVYDGIRQFGSGGWPIPPENSFWYPLLMENGDHYGRRLLRPAFTSWFFSILVHLFANRYFERFGEPVPVGRAPFDERVNVNGQSVMGNVYMAEVIKQLRNRSVVVMPNDRDPSTSGSGTSGNYEYELEYLESQMRGADFERYLTRLDEEISIGLFTPILLLRTADVGSYNLGVGHMQMYLWMLNAMNGDRADYINNYMLSRMVDFNFGVNSPRARIVFRKLGNTNAELVRDLLSSLVSSGRAGVDLRELGEIAGMTVSEIEESLEEPAAPQSTDDGTGDGNEGASSAPGASLGKRVAPVPTVARSVIKDMVNRVHSQVGVAFARGKFGSGQKINMGYRRQMEKAMAADGVLRPGERAAAVYAEMDNWLEIVASLGAEEFGGPEGLAGLFATRLERAVNEVYVA